MHTVQNKSGFVYKPVSESSDEKPLEITKYRILATHFYDGPLTFHGLPVVDAQVHGHEIGVSCHGG